MSEEYNPLDLKATLDRMEPGVAPVPVELALASIAVSAKSISSQLGMITNSLFAMQASISMAPHVAPLQQINNNLVGVGSSIQSISYSLTSLENTIKGKQP